VVLPPRRDNLPVVLPLARKEQGNRSELYCATEPGGGKALCAAIIADWVGLTTANPESVFIAPRDDEGVMCSYCTLHVRGVKSRWMYCLVVFDVSICFDSMCHLRVFCLGGSMYREVVSIGTYREAACLDGLSRRDGSASGGSSDNL